MLLTSLTSLLCMLQVSLELGGNAPCIVFDDADVDVAVKGAVCPIVACISTISNFVVIVGTSEKF